MLAFNSLDFNVWVFFLEGEHVFHLPTLDNKQSYSYPFT